MFLQSMRVRFSDSEQWCSPAKPPRSQNYVKPHDARTRDRLAEARKAAVMQRSQSNCDASSRRHSSQAVRLKKAGAAPGNEAKKHPIAPFLIFSIFGAPRPQHRFEISLRDQLRRIEQLPTLAALRFAPIGSATEGAWDWEIGCDAS